MYICAIATPHLVGHSARNSGSRLRLRHHPDDRHRSRPDQLESADQTRRIPHSLRDLLAILDLKEDSTALCLCLGKETRVAAACGSPVCAQAAAAGLCSVCHPLWHLQLHCALRHRAASWATSFAILTLTGRLFPSLARRDLIFRSRIRTPVNFMKFVYLDKKDRVRVWFTPRRSMALAGIAGALALLPLWHETGDGRFVLEAAESGRGPHPGAGNRGPGVC